MSYFTTSETFFVVPLDVRDGEIQKIEFLLQILEKSNVGKIIENMNFKSSEIGRRSYNPYRLFATILYCFTMHKGTLRNSEEMIRYDVRLWYLMNQDVPSYKTIAEFINEVILPNAYEIFTKITSTIIKELNVDISDQYLDGTKIEANANKYKFVWKPRKAKVNLLNKINDLLIEMEFILDPNQEMNSIKLKEYLKTYESKESIDPNSIPRGKGSRPTPKQKLVKQGYEYLDKLLEYEEKEKICGPNRNSYYKTDHDATAMALKSDYYAGLGSNMHAAYNIQFIVSAGFVLLFGVYQDRTDYYTLIPMLDTYRKYYDAYPKNLCADSGYGIYKNYEYINQNVIGNYVKFQNWNGESSGKNPQRYYLNEEETGFKCMNGNEGKEIPFTKERHQKSYKTKLYEFTGCLDCPYEYKCRAKMKDRDTDYRTAELSVQFEKYKKQARDNLKSIKGIEIRVNRSIQVEGSFGNLKQDVGYVRIRRGGIEKVTCEIMLMALALNIRKLFSVYKDEKVKSKFWLSDSDTKVTDFPKPKPKKKSC